MKRLRLRLWLIGILAASLTVSAHDKETSPHVVPPQPRAPNNLFDTRMPVGPPYDASNIAIPSLYPRPPSEWLNNERSFYEKILFASKYDTLIVPFQVRGYAFNRATRAAMMAELSAAIARASGKKIPDPFLIAKVFGEGRRGLEVNEIIRVATALGVGRIVVGQVGHDRQSKFGITITVLDNKDSTETNKRKYERTFESNFNDGSFDDEHPPIEAFEKLLPTMLTSMGYSSPKLGNAASVSLDVSKLPDTPKDLLTKGRNAARDVYTYLLFSALTPAYIESTKERFAAKAFLALTALSPDSPEYRVLRARAYLGMGYRLAAIKALGIPQADEEKEFQAVLNGNLPEVQALAAKERHPFKKLLMKLDENEIVEDYGKYEKAAALNTVKELGLPGEVWPYLVERKFRDHDIWSQYDNLSLKKFLDSELTVSAYSLGTALAGATLVNSSDAALAAASLSVGEHVKKYIEADPLKTCCRYRSFHVSDFDYLELWAAIGHDNLLGRIRFLSRVQGRPQAAIEFANTIDAVYRGYPYYSAVRAKAEYSLSEKAGGVAGEALAKKAYEGAFNALYWEQAQSRVADEAMGTLSEVGTHPYGYFGNPYASDLPYLPGYTPWEGTAEATIKNGLAAIGNSTSQFDSVGQLISLPIINRDPKVIERAARAIEGRFVGCPAKNIFLAHSKIEGATTESAIEQYRESIRQSPEHFRAYMELGKLLHESGKPQEASKVFLSYPGLKPGDEKNHVDVANTAYEMGSYFYQSGDIDLVKPFYKISAAQDVGAQSDLSAALRLALLDGDLDAAAPAMLKAAQRYSDPARFRDYFGVLHAMGYSKDAWTGFDAIVNNIDRPEVWETALVGHHQGKATESDVTRWVNQLQYKKAGRDVSFAAMYIARFVTTDRMPSKGIADFIASFDRPVWRIESSGQVVRPVVDGSMQRELGPRIGNKADDSVRMSGFESIKKAPVRSDLAYFVQAYRHIKLKEYSQAKSIFDEAAKFYDLTSDRSSYMLPYYAIAAAKVGDVAAIHAILDNMPAIARRFDYQLAKASLEAMAGKSADALQSLTLARYRRSNTFERPLLTHYTFGEICEMLFSLTGNTKIRDLAIEWVKARQRVEPWQSFSYAIEAALTTDSAARQRAIAMAYYLDPNSERLTRFKKSEIDAAVAVSGASNIFRESNKKEGGRTRT